MKAKDALRHAAGYLFGLFLFFVVLPFGLVRLAAADPTVPVPFPEYPVFRLILSLPLFLPGLFFIVWSNFSLFKVGKGGPADGFNIAVSPRTKHLVVNGPYRLSRNPMVFGAFAAYFGIGVFLLSPLCLAVLAALLGPSVLYLRLTEEKRLRRDFGPAYDNYRTTVPMIFPGPAGGPAGIRPSDGPGETPASRQTPGKMV